MKFYLTTLACFVISAVLGAGCESETKIVDQTAHQAVTAQDSPDETKTQPVETPSEPEVVKESPAEMQPEPETEVAAAVESTVLDTNTAPAVPAEPEPEAVEVAPPVETAVEPNKAGVAVTVNGVDITESDVQERIKQQLEQITAGSAKVPPQVIERYKKQLQQQALQGMIVEHLLDERVKQANIVVTEEDVIEQLKEMASQQQEPLTLEGFKELVESNGQNFDELKQRIQKGLGYRRLMENELGDKIKVTEEDARNLYDENPDRFQKVRASHILIKPDTADPNTDPNQAKADARAKAQDLLNQIRDGADFATLAKANSGCPTASKGGDLGFFAKGQMVPAFDKVAFELKVGQVSDVVETQFGFHIIRTTDSKEGFERSREEIMAMLTQKKQGEAGNSYIESLKAEADIVYPPGKEPPPQPARGAVGARAPNKPVDKSDAKK